MSRFTECLTKWEFKDDPFRESYPPDKLWARPQEDLDYIKYLIEDAKDSKTTVNIFLRGDYGSGKTYTLHALKSFVQDDLSGKGIFFRMPTRTTARGFRDILSQFIHEVNIDDLVEIGKEICKQRSFEKYEDFYDFLIQFISISDVAKSLCNLIFDKEFVLTKTWLTGEANLTQTKQLDFTRASREEETAVAIISDVINFLGLKYSIVAILIDEIENLSGTSRPIRSVREGLRNLYDEIIYTTRNSSVVMFTAATGVAIYEFDVTLGGALLDRFDRELYLKPLSVDEQKQFVINLFNWAREDVSNKISPPFSNIDALDRYIQLVPATPVIPKSRSSGYTGTPRRLIKVGKELLHQACFRNVDLITDDDVRSLLKCDSI